MEKSPVPKFSVLMSGALVRVRRFNVNEVDFGSLVQPQRHPHPQAPLFTQGPPLIVKNPAYPKHTR